MHTLYSHESQLLLFQFVSCTWHRAAAVRGNLTESPLALDPLFASSWHMGARAECHTNARGGCGAVVVVVGAQVSAHCQAPGRSHRATAAQAARKALAEDDSGVLDGASARRRGAATRARARRARARARHAGTASSRRREPPSAARCRSTAARAPASRPPSPAVPLAPAARAAAAWCSQASSRPCGWRARALPSRASL